MQLQPSLVGSFYLIGNSTGWLKTTAKDRKKIASNQGSLVICRCVRDEILPNYIYIYIYTWNPNDPCFAWKGPCFGGFSPQNTGQTGSRCVLFHMPFSRYEPLWQYFFYGIVMFVGFSAPWLRWSLWTPSSLPWKHNIEVKPRENYRQKRPSGDFLVGCMCFIRPMGPKKNS